ncbi:hypothetical protein ACFQ0B_73055 [Nonomuraea thailandensis]
MSRSAARGWVSYTESRKRTANSSTYAGGGSSSAWIVSRQYRVARPSHGCAATAGSWAATRCATAAVMAVICRDEVVASPPDHQGAVAVESVSGSENGSPPSGSVTVSSQSHSAAACGEVTGAASSNTSKACSAAPGWLSGERRSGSSPQP